MNDFDKTDIHLINIWIILICILCNITVSRCNDNDHTKEIVQAINNIDCSCQVEKE